MKPVTDVWKLATLFFAPFKCMWNNLFLARHLKSMFLMEFKGGKTLLPIWKITTGWNHSKHYPFGWRHTSSFLISNIFVTIEGTLASGWIWLIFVIHKLNLSKHDSVTSINDPLSPVSLYNACQESELFDRSENVTHVIINYFYSWSFSVSRPVVCWWNCGRAYWSYLCLGHSSQSYISTRRFHVCLWLQSGEYIFSFSPLVRVYKQPSAKSRVTCSVLWF